MMRDLESAKQRVRRVLDEHRGFHTHELDDETREDLLAALVNAAHGSRDDGVIEGAVVAIAKAPRVVGGPTRGGYWTLVDISTSGYSETYEHQLPHGTLIRVKTTTRGDGMSESIVFVANPPSMEPYR
jgi:hypothetical protein